MSPWSAIPNPLQIGGNGQIGELDILDGNGNIIGKITDISNAPYIEFFTNEPWENTGTAIALANNGNSEQMDIIGPSSVYSGNLGKDFVYQILCSGANDGSFKAFWKLIYRDTNQIDHVLIFAQNTVIQFSVPIEDGIYPGDNVLTLNNGWIPFGAPYGTPAAELVPLGQKKAVLLEGVLHNGSGSTADGTQILTVPSFCTPTVDRLMPVGSDDNAASPHLVIDTTGAGRIYGLGSTVDVSLDGLIYRL